MISRRTFLAASLAPGWGRRKGRSTPPTRTPTPPLTPGSFDPWVELNAQNLRHNVAEVALRAGRRPVLAVIKNNGYGLGLPNAARLLEPEPSVRGFAVVKLQEAVTLRDAGIQKPILLMGPFSEQELIDEIAPHGIMPMVYRDHGEAFDRAAARQPGSAKPLSIHVKVDTGLGRVGVPHHAVWELVDAIRKRRSTSVAGVMTTLSEDPALDEEQLRRFRTLRTEFERKNIASTFHAASSFALFRKDDAALFDMVRPGMALFGVYSEPPFRRLGLMELRPALALRARVALVKQLQPGESAGYNRAFAPAQPTWIATLPVGHADGWPRIAAKGARVRIGDRLYPVVASVSASHTIVDLGTQTSVARGDVATLFDWTDGSRPEDVAESCGASVYDLTMHLNALLPRRIVAS